jgi:hypothetical protein
MRRVKAVEHEWSHAVTSDTRRPGELQEERALRFPIVAANTDGKEGVDGSSPSMSSKKCLPIGIFCRLVVQHAGTSRVQFTVSTTHRDVL